MRSKKIAVKIVVVIAILALVLSALAPLFYAFAPRYEFAPVADEVINSEVIESVVTE
jgi:hypothetical protein